jgi:hypothetical protein
LCIIEKFQYAPANWGRRDGSSVFSPLFVML